MVRARRTWRCGAAPRSAPAVRRVHEHADGVRERAAEEDDDRRPAGSPRGRARSRSPGSRVRPRRLDRARRRSLSAGPPPPSSLSRQRRPAGAARCRRPSSRPGPDRARALQDVAQRGGGQRHDRRLLRGRPAARPVVVAVLDHLLDRVAARLPSGTAGSGSSPTAAGVRVAETCASAPRPSPAAARPAPGGRRGRRPAPRPGSGTRVLSMSTGSRRSSPSDSNSTGTWARRPRSRVARRSVGTRPRSSSTIGRTSKMKFLVASSVCWTIETSSCSSPVALVGSRVEQPLHDLRLEDDVGQRLGRPVVHRAGDLAAQVLLGGQDDARDGGGLGDRRRRAAATPPSLAAADHAVEPVRERGQASRWRARALRLPSRTSTWASISDRAPGQRDELP